MSTIVIQTALPLEQMAVVSKLSKVVDYIHPGSKTIYKVGKYVSKGNELKIIVGRTNQTNVNAGIETERIIQHFKPEYIFFVGVAGGLKDVRVGDIVIGSDVYGYERGKVKNKFLPRPQFGFSSYELEQNAVNYSTTLDWKQHSASFVNIKFQDSIIAFSGTIASGEKVIDAVDSALYNFLKTNCSHALAVEMEGLGFLEACRPYPLIKSLIIRGISDLVDGKEHSDKEGSQPYAIKNATEFLFGLIDFLRIKQEIKPLTIKQKLSEIIPKLYPSGLRENAIWIRSGGDLSVVNLYLNGKTQWIEALVLIENGGGGNIDFNSIIREMKIDYPRSESLKQM
jgi:adenosylhomocysteine nucleosidase